MKNLFRSKKALSPVVAAIILIAVTVAVSIAVAAWMGALTFTFMATEQVSITGVRYTSASALIINVTNTGSAKVTINAVEISGNPAASMSVSWSSDDTTSGNELNPGERAALTVTSSSTFTAGVSYEFVVITMGGNRFGPYVKTYSG
jgi:flagellin-like protein